MGRASRSLIRALPVALCACSSSAGEPPPPGTEGAGGFVGSGSGGTAAITGGSGGNLGIAGQAILGGASGGPDGAPGAGAVSGAGGERGSGGASPGGVPGGGGAAGSIGTGGSPGAPTRPCDLFAAGSTPCVAAHSTVRALYRAYAGNLYQVRRAADRLTRDIPVETAGGYADAAAQDAFCSSACVITIVYDQSGRGNDLEYQGAGSGVGGQDTPASATSESVRVASRRVYSLYIQPGNSYWRDGHASGIPTGAAPEGIYMVTSGTHANGGCCFDYGNSETDRSADGPGAMDAIYFGTSCWFGGCAGHGPWVQADLEYGLFPGGSTSWNPAQVAFESKYVTAVLKNDGRTRFALKGGDAQSSGLTTLWDGSLPRGYGPMRKQGAIVLGSGGDCCARNTNLSLGTFYEGAIVSGYPSDDTDAALQRSIVAAGYE